MKRPMLGFSLKDQTQNEVIRQRTKVADTLRKSFLSSLYLQEGWDRLSVHILEWRRHQGNVV